MIGSSQNRDVHAFIQSLSRRTERYRLALRWLKENKMTCLRCTGGVFSSVSHEDAVLHIEKQVKLLENEMEKVKYVVLKGHF